VPSARRQLQVLLHVFPGQRIDGTNGEGRVRRDERHIHQSAVRHGLDRHSREELADQPRFGDSGCLDVRPRWRTAVKPGERRHDLFRQRRDHLAEPLRRGTDRAELGHSDEIEAPHDAESQLTTGENAVLRFVVDLGVFPVIRAPAVEGACERRLLLVLHLNHQACLRPIERSGRERPEHRAQHDEHDDTHRDVSVLVDDAQAIEEVCAVGRERWPDAAAARPGRTSLDTLLLRGVMRFLHPLRASRKRPTTPSFSTGLCKRPA
jgi:hypothetical protein